MEPAPHDGVAGARGSRGFSPPARRQWRAGQAPVDAGTIGGGSDRAGMAAAA